LAVRTAIAIIDGVAKPLPSGDTLQDAGGNAIGGSGDLDIVTPPAHYNSPGTQNQIAIDDDYLYVCVSTDRWKRFLGFTNF